MCQCADDCVSVHIWVDEQDPIKAKLRERVIESRTAVHRETTAQVDKRKDFEAAVSRLAQFVCELLWSTLNVIGLAPRVAGGGGCRQLTSHSVLFVVCPQIKRPYFHAKPLDKHQLQNWHDYLDFEVAQGDHRRTVFLFERCVIACAMYEEFWLKVRLTHCSTVQDAGALLGYQACALVCSAVQHFFRVSGGLPL